MKKAKGKVIDDIYLNKNGANNQNKRISIVATLETQNFPTKEYINKELKNNKKNNNENEKKEILSFKGSSFPIFLSAMTNAKNNLKLINTKFINKSRKNNYSFNDNSTLVNKSNNLNYNSMIYNYQKIEQNGKNISIPERKNHKKLDLKINFPQLKKTHNLKLISSRNAKKYLSIKSNDKNILISNNNDSFKINKIKKSIYEQNKNCKSFTIDNSLEKYHQLNQKLKEISKKVNNKPKEKKLNHIIYKKIKKFNDLKNENETKQNENKPTIMNSINNNKRVKPINNSINNKNFWEDNKFNNSTPNILKIPEKNKLQFKENKNQNLSFFKKNESVNQIISIEKENENGNNPEKTEKIKKEMKKNKDKKKHHTFILKKKIDEKQIKFIGLNEANNTNKDLEEHFFLKEIKYNSDYNKKYENKRYINSHKISLILNQKINLEKIISKKREKLKIYNFGNQSKKPFEINEIKEIYKNKMKKYRIIYFDIYKNSISRIIFYNYIWLINKCGLDMNLLNYMIIHVEFSSIYLPIVKLKSSRQGDRGGSIPQIITKKLFTYKRTKTLFDGKTKFIESIENKSKLQFITINLICRELFNTNKNLKHINRNFFSEKTLLNNATLQKKKSLFKLRKSNYLRSNSLSKDIQNSKRRSSSYVNQSQDKHISVLNQKKFFNINSKLKNSLKQSVLNNLMYYKLNGRKNREMENNNKDFTKQIISAIHEYKINKNHKNTIDAFELIRKIKGKKNIEIILRTLIKEGEILLFIEYFTKYERHIDINSRDEDGNTFLIISIKEGIYSIIDFLLERGIDVNISNNEGNTALHFALSAKKFQLADILKNHGARENCINIYGLTPWESVGKSIEEC